MAFLDFFRKIKSKEVNLSTGEGLTPETQLSISMYALHTITNLIAALISKCEFKTYIKNKEIRGLEWVSLNIKPNINQTSTEFWHELMFKLLVDGEVLVVEVNNQKIIADTFEIERKIVYDSIFSNVTRDNFTFNRTFKSSEVVYMQYSNSNVKLILDSIFALYNELIETAATKYKNSSGERGILKISTIARNDPQFTAKYSELMNSYFKSYFKAKNAVLPLFEGYEYQMQGADRTQYTNEVSDFKNMFDDALARTAQAYRVPGALVKSDIAGLSDAYDIMLTNCIDPLANMISEAFTAAEFTPHQIAEGYSIEADTNCIKHIDIFNVASSADKLVSCGAYTPDEVRVKIGDKETGLKEMQQHYITKNYQEQIDMSKGGE